MFSVLFKKSSVLKKQSFHEEASLFNVFTRPYSQKRPSDAWCHCVPKMLSFLFRGWDEGFGYWEGWGPKGTQRMSRRLINLGGCLLYSWGSKVQFVYGSCWSAMSFFPHFWRFSLCVTFHFLVYQHLCSCFALPGLVWRQQGPVPHRIACVHNM